MRTYIRDGLRPTGSPPSVSGSGKGEQFRQTFLHGAEFGPCCEALANASLPCVLDSKALVLVKRRQYADVEAPS